MARTLDEFIDALPEEEQAAIEQSYQVMNAEYLTLKDLRQAQKMTQEALAAELNMDQGNLSRLERQGDIMLSTLRKYIEAMGGTLNLVAQFPNRPPVNISGFSESLRD